MHNKSVLARVPILYKYRYVCIYLQVGAVWVGNCHFNENIWPATSYIFTMGIKPIASESLYRISANSFRGNYSFLKVGVRQLFKGGNYSKEETIVLWQFLTLWHYSQILKFWQQLCFFFTKTSYFLAICFKKIYFWIQVIQFSRPNQI